MDCESVSNYAILMPKEKQWQEVSEYLELKGYQLRPRYRKHWTPSWESVENKGKHPRCFEDHILLPRNWDSGIDAIQLSTGRQVWIKRCAKNPTDEETLPQAYLQEPRETSLNRCVPLLEILEGETGSDIRFLVMPFLRPAHDPPLETVADIIDFTDQIIEGLEYIHELGVLTSRGEYRDVMMDANALFPNGFHPVRLHLDPLARHKAKRISRREARVNYYYTAIDFEPMHHCRLPSNWESQTHDGRVFAPELFGDKEPNPFEVDIWDVGQIIKTRLYDVYSNVAFLDCVLLLMLDWRSKASDVHIAWKASRPKLNAFALSRRLRRRSESPLQAIVLDAVSLFWDSLRLIRRGMAWINEMHGEPASFTIIAIVLVTAFKSWPPETADTHRTVASPEHPHARVNVAVFDDFHKFLQTLIDLPFLQSCRFAFMSHIPHKPANRLAFVKVLLKGLRAATFGRIKQSKIEIYEHVYQGNGRYSATSIYSRLAPHDPYEESPQWISERDRPVEMAFNPSTQISITVQSVIEGKPTLLSTENVLILNLIADAARDQMEGFLIVNLQMWAQSDLSLHSHENMPRSPRGTLRLMFSILELPADGLKYSPPEGAPIPTLGVVKRQEPTNMVFLRILYAYRSLIDRFYPEPTPPLVRITHITLARAARYHWTVNKGRVFTNNPAEDLAQQLRDFLLFLHSADQVNLLHNDSSAQVDVHWTRHFPSMKFHYRLPTVLRTIKAGTAHTILRADIVAEVFKAAVILDMAKEDHSRMRYIDMYSRGNFGPEVRDRQLTLFEYRFRTVMFFENRWVVPAAMLSREEIVRILLHYSFSETGRVDDRDRPYTTALASPTGKEAEQVEKIIYQELLSCSAADHRDHHRRVLTRLAQRAGTLPASLRLHDVQALTQLPSGGFADVYKGKWGHKQVVIKSGKALQSASDDPEIKAKLFLELITWATVQHSRILQFHGYTDIAGIGQLCMVSPYMEGKTAQERCSISSKNRLDLNTRKRLLKEISEGMAYLHSEDVIHGDLRGPNVFLTPDLRVKIADFGLSVYASGVTNNYYSLRTGNTRWIAPELMDSTSTPSPELQRERKALEERAGGNDELMHIYRPTKPSDVYSFACTCIEILSGRVPYFDQKTDTQVIHFVTTFRHVNGTRQSGRPPRPDDLLSGKDDNLWDVIQSCWASQVTARPNFDGIHRTLCKIV